MKVITTWKGDMAFDSLVNGHIVPLDATEKVGGKDSGPRPKDLILTAISGCTGMDVVSILKKMRVTEYSLKIEMDADQSTEHPVVYTKIYMNYIFEGENLPVAKIKKAVTLSEDRYCGVSAMLKKATIIEATITINGETV